jgi:anti-sigma B factor antagonist
MEVTVTQQDTVTVAALHGELDGRSSNVVQQTVLALAQPGIRLLLDMQGVRYISSAGLRTLLMIYRQISNGQGQVVLAGLSAALRDMMAITGFLEFFTAYDSFDEGVRALQGEDAGRV